ncbi:MAG: hypothetical protein IJ479_01420, partial [Alphaproteobacteria bacterium]|nr:hypothetical protein [Alphaproteobacteria bacterium]
SFWLLLFVLCIGMLLSQYGSASLFKRNVKQLSVQATKRQDSSCLLAYGEVFGLIIQGSKTMQNIIRYTKILMNIGTKILLGLLGLLQIYEIGYVFIHNYGSEGIYFYKGQIVYQYIF